MFSQQPSEILKLKTKVQVFQYLRAKAQAASTWSLLCECVLGRGDVGEGSRRSDSIDGWSGNEINEDETRGLNFLDPQKGNGGLHIKVCRKSLILSLSFKTEFCESGPTWKHIETAELDLPSQ